MGEKAVNEERKRKFKNEWFLKAVQVGREWREVKKGEGVGWMDGIRLMGCSE